MRVLGVVIERETLAGTTKRNNIGNLPCNVAMEKQYLENKKQQLLVNIKDIYTCQVRYYCWRGSPGLFVF